MIVLNTQKIDGRKEVAKVVFDLAKYLLTAVAISSIFAEKIRLLSAIIASILGILLLYLGYFLMSDKE
ncbi:hypothetical protein A45J_0153 [hot springs metagenome]|uniref:Uncharacterized protein n=1 Tax=hot springs metagenome TaxID=433727 RepID=A0A5J4L0Z0_9ZZZZ